MPVAVNPCRVFSTVSKTAASAFQTFRLYRAGTYFRTRTSGNLSEIFFFFPKSVYSKDGKSYKFDTVVLKIIYRFGRSVSATPNGIRSHRTTVGLSMVSIGYFSFVRVLTVRPYARLECYHKSFVLLPVSRDGDAATTVGFYRLQRIITPRTCACARLTAHWTGTDAESRRK